MLSLMPCMLAVALAALSPSATEASLVSRMRHVRATNTYLQQLIRSGAYRSNTFRSLLTHLEQSDVIVYVEPATQLPPNMNGRLQMLGSGHGQRYLRIEVTLEATATDLIALIAHELQHATEVADAVDVHDQLSLATLYKRIGHRGATENEFETWAALNTGRAVRKELKA